MTKQIAVFAGVVTLLAAPVGAQNREHQQIAAETRMMQEQLQQLALSLTMLSQAVSESVTAMTARIDAVNQAMLKGFAEQKLLTDNLGNDVRVVRERTDETSVRMGTLRDELEAVRATMLALQQAAAAAAAAQTAAQVDPNAPPPDPSAVPPAPVVPAPVAPPLPSTAGLSPQRMFNEAQSDYFAANYAAAIAGFDAFLRAFPRVELSDDAYFLIGESHFNQNQWTEAVAAYNQVIQNYAGTNAMPDAYYKRGLAQERAGDVEAARASWEAVLRFAPDSTAAILAKQNLDRTGPAAQAR
jgi:TolA-binding protein